MDAPLLEEPGDVDLARLPAWMRGAPEHGPPDLEQAQAQAAVGAVEDESSSELPEWDG